MTSIWGYGWQLNRLSVSDVVVVQSFLAGLRPRAVVDEFGDLAFEIGFELELAEGVVGLALGIAEGQRSSELAPKRVIGERGFAAFGVADSGEAAVGVVIVFVAGVCKHTIILWVWDFGQDHGGESSEDIVFEFTGDAVCPSR